MSEAQVFVYSLIPSVDRGEGVSSKPLVQESSGATAFVNGITSFPRGRGMPLHTHNVDESVTVLEGRGRFESGRMVQEVRPWDTVFVPAGVPHRFVNSGDDSFRILWVYGGTQVTRTFVESGKTVPHLSDKDRVAQKSD